MTDAAQHQTEARSIYVAGPMTGVPDFNFPLFNAVTHDLRRQGFEVSNPAEFGEFEGDDGTDSADMRARYMERDLAHVVNVDAICLLPGWEESKGANMELLTALMTGKEIWGLVQAIDDEGKPFATFAYLDVRPNLWLVMQHVEEVCS